MMQRMSMKFQKLLDIDEAFARFEKAHYDYIATLSGNLEEWELKHVILRTLQPKNEF